MALPVVVGVGNVANGTGDVVPTNPTGSIQNDFLVMAVEQSAVNVFGSTPTGWAGIPGAQVKVASGADDGNITLYYRVFQTGDGNPTVPDTINHTSARIIGFRGCVTGTAWETIIAGIDTGVNNSFSASGTATLGADRMIAVFGGTANDIAMTTGVSGFANADLANVTERMDNYHTDGNGGGFFCATGEKAAQGSFGATTATLSVAANKAWVVLVLKPPDGAQTYNDSVSVSRTESVSDRETRDLQSLLTLAERDGVTDGMTNSILSNLSLAMVDGVSDGQSATIPKVSALNKVLTLSDLAGVGVFPALTLLQILSTTPANFANMQGSVGLSGDLGISGDQNSNINPNASLLSVMGVNIAGGLSLLSDLTIAERLGFSVLGNVGVYPSLTLGRDLAFIPANIALIGGSVSIGQSLGMIDVPNLNAQAALSFLQSLGITLSSALSTQTVEAILNLAESLGISTAAQLNSFPLVGINNKLFLVDANNANMFGSNVLSEIRTLNILGGISIQENVVIPIDFNLLTSKLVSVFGNVNVQGRLGISDSVISNMQASVALGEVAGMGNAVNQILNAGLGISIVGSVLTISGINVIIVKGFVFTSDLTRSSVLPTDSSKTASTSDSGKSSASTNESPNYISTDDG